LGSWILFADCCRSSNRFGFDPDNRKGSLGFRPACSIFSNVPGGINSQLEEETKRELGNRDPAKTTDYYYDSLIPGFSYVREETFSCGGQTNTVKIYNHEKTGLEFVLVPGGSGVDSFLICRTECTQAAWKRIVGSTPWEGKDYVAEGDDYPATYISWDDCGSFCEKTGLRLPSEKEWEYACRAGSITEYCFRDSEFGLGSYAWYDDNVWAIGEKYAHRVGQKKPNLFGLFDVHGNVWEWCQDLYSSGSSFRVFRGGGWSGSAEDCRSTHRCRKVPGYRGLDLGFRPAFSLP